MFWLEGAEVEGSYFKQKNYHPSSPWCCLINSVNSLVTFIHMLGTFSRILQYIKEAHQDSEADELHIGFYYIGGVPVGEDLFSTARPCNNNPM